MDGRSILHCDLDNFFASVEARFDPSLADKPFAVCGSVEDRHGIVLAKNPIAKRYGIKTAEAIWQAKLKCPSLLVVAPHYDRYKEFSHYARQMYNQYTDMVEPFGIDECWLDVTGSRMLFGSGESIAREINLRMKKELGITVSVGVSFNKCFAKLGSDLNKPDGVSVITRESFRDIVWPLPAENLLWVGKNTKKVLDNLGIMTIGDIAAMAPSVLRSNLGKSGEALWHNAMGHESSPVLRESEMPAAKSIGKSVTGRRDLVCNEDVRRVFLSLADSISHSLRSCGLLAGTVQIHIRDSLLGVTEHQCKLSQPTRLGIVLANEGMKLFENAWSWQRPIRSVGIRATELVRDDETVQLCFDSDCNHDDELERLEQSCDRLRSKYGSACIKRASLI